MPLTTLLTDTLQLKSNKKLYSCGDRKAAARRCGPASGKVASVALLVALVVRLAVNDKVPSGKLMPGGGLAGAGPITKEVMTTPGVPAVIVTRLELVVLVGGAVALMPTVVGRAVELVLAVVGGMEVLAPTVVGGAVVKLVGPLIGTAVLRMGRVAVLGRAVVGRLVALTPFVVAGAVPVELAVE